MSCAVVVALALAWGAPPDPMDAAPGEPPPAPSDPDDAHRAPPDAPPAAVTPAPDARPTPSRPMQPLTLAALQCGVGCLVMLGALPLGIVCTSLTCLGLPFLIGYFETWAGDRFGPDRAPAIAPILTAYGGTLATLLLGGGVYLGSTILGVPADLKDPFTIGAVAAGAGMTLAAVPIAYRLTAVPKHPLDDGEDRPDFLTPRVPDRR